MSFSRTADVRRRVQCWGAVAISIVLLGPPALAQAPLAVWDFETGGLEDFFNPSGNAALSFCTDGIIPSGLATVVDGEVVMTNDDFVGICILGLAPGTMGDLLGPGQRNYRVRAKVRLDTVNEISMHVRGRIGMDVDLGQADSFLERGYAVALVGPGLAPEQPDGFIAVAEFTACHELVPHPEWPGGARTGFATVGIGTPITADDWYWIEATVEGNDEGGPVRIAVRAWLDGDDPPECLEISVVDQDGIAHTPDTLGPGADAEILFGTSFDFGQQPGASAQIDEIRIDRPASCAEPPLTARRTLWTPRMLVEGQPTSVYDPSSEHGVSLELVNLRPAGACPAPASAIVCERVPPGWTVTSASAGGVIDGEGVSWSVNLAGGLPAPLTYNVMAGAGSGIASFSGSVKEVAGERGFAVEGESNAVGAASIPGISDFGSIQHWLVLGPFTREIGGANPGDDQIVRDYLTDGVVTQETVRPLAGDTLLPEYGAAAASTGLAPDLFGRNPDEIPRWVEWRDLDDADDRVDFESIYGPLNDVVCHALAYLDVEVDTTVHFGVSSDDSVHILLDGEELHKNNVARGAEGRTYQDTPLTHPNLGNVDLSAGQHVLLVKVFDGGGEHNFRVGFVDETGIEIPGGPEEVTVSLVPVEPSGFRRGDGDASGGLDITDGVFTLNFLFSGGPAPPCPDAADTTGDGEINITDPIAVLNYLFLGQAAPPAPGPTTCGPDPVADLLGPCIYVNC